MGCVSSKSSGGDGQQRPAQRQPGDVEYGEEDEFQQIYQKYEQPDEAFKKSNKKPETDNQIVELAQDEGVEKFNAVKPWIGALKAPTNPPIISKEAPQIKLQLEYVNGFKCEDSRQTIHYTQSDDEIVYPAGAFLVKLNLKTNQQTFFGVREYTHPEGHNDDVECIDVNPDKTLVASGQRGKNPQVIIWDLKTREHKGKFFLGNNGRSCTNIKFSKCGKYLFAVDLSNDHNIHVFNANNQQKIDSKKTGGDIIVDFDTSPVGSSFAGAIVGKRTVQFVSFNGTQIQQIKRGIQGGVGKLEDFLCASYVPTQVDHLLTGDVKGNLLVWEGGQAKQVIPFQQGFIYSIFSNDSSVFLSCSKSKSVYRVDLAALLKGEKSVQNTISIEGVAQSLKTSSSNQQLVIGTTNGRILTVAQDQSTKTVIDAHFAGETWGLDYEANTKTIVTAGDDNKLISFDTVQNRVIQTAVVNSKAGPKKAIGGASTLSKYPPNQCARAVAVNQSNGHVAIATNQGEVSIRQSARALGTFVVNTKSVGTEWIEVLRYSPDQRYLAVGSHDNNVYILDSSSNYSQVAVCKANNSFITSLDWSEDSQKIRTNSGSYELLFFNALQGQQLPDGATATRDEKWATNTCRITWENQGIYPPATDGSHINGVDRSKSGRFSATGDDWGLVNLFNLPNIKGSKYTAYRAHSSHVVRVLFDDSDKYLYSVGGFDKLLLKWKIVK